MPVSLVEGIEVDFWMDLKGTQTVRILQDPISKNIVYTTFDGFVYEIIEKKSGKRKEKRLFSVKDHGISRLQGAIFLDSTLFLSGNIQVNDGKGTKGIMMRGDLKKNGKRVWSRVFITEDVGSTKTLYDHGFNGLAISPDKKHIFINSGARTDHGELQENDGFYPGARDVPLTACVLRIPSSTINLFLPNNYNFLKEHGYLYADGIRNAYDLEFSNDGELFAVSNSSDYDHPEDMFWLREGHHYGFPWVMGNTPNPQQFPDWQADPTKDPFINTFAHAYRMKYFVNDPDFPKPPEGVVFSSPVRNLGPDINLYRDLESGIVMDGDTTGFNVGTFTPHLSPLGLFFDRDSVFTEGFKGDGFMLNYSSPGGSLNRDFYYDGGDLIHLTLKYNSSLDNYDVICEKLVNKFRGPTDAVLIKNSIFIIVYGGKKTPSKIWKVTMPSDIY